MEKLYDIKYKIAKLIAQSTGTNEPQKYSFDVNTIISSNAKQTTKILHQKYGITDNKIIQRILWGYKSSNPFLQSSHVNTNSNSSISFDNNACATISQLDERLGRIKRIINFVDYGDENFIYLQHVVNIFNLLTNYKYPCDFKLKDLSNCEPDLIFFYEGKEVSLDALNQLYNKLKKEENEILEQCKIDGSYATRKLNDKLSYKGSYSQSSPEKKDIDGTFKQLFSQFEEYVKSLPNEEREQLENSLLVYNSCLYEAINKMATIPGFREMDPRKLAEELWKSPDFQKTSMIFIRSMLIGTDAIKQGDINYDSKIYKKLGIVKLSSVEEYIQSLILVYDTILKHSNKLRVPEDITIYRGISDTQNNKVSSLARSDLISTSLHTSTSQQFFRGSNNPVLFIAKLKKGTPFMLMPYRLTSQVKSYVPGRQWLRYNHLNRLEYTDDDYDFSMNPITQNAELLLFNHNINFTFSEPYSIRSGFSNITIMPTEIFPKEIIRDTTDVPDINSNINTNDEQEI